MKILILVLPFLLLACSSVQRDSRYMAESDYRSKETLKGGLIGPADPLNESAIQKMLSGKIVFPKSMHLAIVRLPSVNENVNFEEITSETSDKLYKRENWGSRVADLIPVPELLIAKPASITALRQAAVYLQADALLVVKPLVHSDWKYLLFQQNQAVATTTLEVILLDTRTGAIPYTAIFTETAKVAKEDKDFSESELEFRARKTSEMQALLQIPGAVKKFLSQMP